jgi:hypothetical protein
MPELTMNQIKLVVVKKALKSNQSKLRVCLVSIMEPPELILDLH